MVPVTAISYRRNNISTVATFKTSIFLISRHLALPKFVLKNLRMRVPFVLKEAYASSPGLVLGVTNSPLKGSRLLSVPTSKRYPYVFIFYPNLGLLCLFIQTTVVRSYHTPPIRVTKTSLAYLASSPTSNCANKVFPYLSPD
jgi:hypothetical protein